MTWMQLLLVSYGVYRVSRMLALEYGPFHVFTRIRGALASLPRQHNWLSEGAGCPLCISWWIAGLAAAGLVLAGQAAWGDLWYLWPGIAGLAAAAYQVHR